MPIISESTAQITVATFITDSMFPPPPPEVMSSSFSQKQRHRKRYYRRNRSYDKNSDESVAAPEKASSFPLSISLTRKSSAPTSSFFIAGIIKYIPEAMPQTQAKALCNYPHRAKPTLPQAQKVLPRPPFQSLFRFFHIGRDICHPAYSVKYKQYAENIRKNIYYVYARIEQHDNPRHNKP